MIQIKDLNFGYSKKALLFKNLNLNLSKGHIYGLLGKNGAGKSTLLHNITGLTYPQSGYCFVNGLSSADRSVDFLSDMYFIPEEIFMPAVTAAQFVKNTAPFYPQFNEDQFYGYIEEFEVPREAVLDKMSFGQQKKAMIAFGLATNTSLLVMDEPTNGLDIPSKVQFRKTIASVLTEDRCVIISTHQVRDLDSLIDTLVVLNDREIVVNEALDMIAEKLYFTTLESDDKQATLYHEDSIRGKNAILANADNLYSKVDMELLFNAIVSNNQSVINLLNTPTK
ncbi:ABC transporter ATP-binding protein [Mucilaginibacter sp. PPCGB 2223]|uniref:ATP-binding cassette domain-containing protein n=1 Tax=Mucilaginibacter sp. PPCGB 2223 TaxID=1886027 RepID=UPI00082649C3|nr:ABC transporter ATP-binding protein [Mucilaginibacter sp. PPCGB 2223]OCX53408.1 ABC transporter ATP-binding protein [Mucilaginibacter sp. PPCGB 2223]